MLSENPNFDYEKIQREIENKTIISNLPTTISNKKIKKDRDLRIELLEISQSIKLIIKWLNKIDRKCHLIRGGIVFCLIDKKRRDARSRASPS